MLCSYACAFFLIIATLNLASVFRCILATLKSCSVKSLVMLVIQFLAMLFCPCNLVLTMGIK